MGTCPLKNPYTKHSPILLHTSNTLRAIPSIPLPSLPYPLTQACICTTPSSPITIFHQHQSHPPHQIYPSNPCSFFNASTLATYLDCASGALSFSVSTKFFQALYLALPYHPPRISRHRQEGRWPNRGCRKGLGGRGRRQTHLQIKHARLLRSIDIGARADLVEGVDL